MTAVSPSQQTITPDMDAAELDLLERVLVGGDLSKLTPAQRLYYYRQVCDSLGLNPLTRPFEYITLNGRLSLYASRNCTDQLRATRNVSVTIVARERLDDLYVVTARATTPDGRTDESIGVVMLAGLRGDALANALMRAETKAKRRVTLSICGLSWVDESEVPSIPHARPVEVDHETGEILIPAGAAPAPPAPPGRASGPTPAQKNQINALVGELGWKSAQFADWTQDTFGCEPSAMTTGQAARAIAFLLEQRALKRGEQPPLSLA